MAVTVTYQGNTKTQTQNSSPIQPIFAIPAGSLVIVLAAYLSLTSNCNVADTVGNIYTAIPSINLIATGYTGAVYYAITPTALSTSDTVTFQTGPKNINDTNIQLLSIQGLTTEGILISDGVVTTANNLSGTITARAPLRVTSNVPTTPAEVFLGIGLLAERGGGSAGNNDPTWSGLFHFSTGTSSGKSNVMGGYIISSGEVAQTYNISIGNASSANWAGVVISFRQGQAYSPLVTWIG